MFSISTWILGIIGSIISGIVVYISTHRFFKIRMSSKVKYKNDLNLEFLKNGNIFDDKVILQSNDKQSSIPTPPKKRLKLKDYDSWCSQQKGKIDGSEWFAIYVLGFCFLLIPLILIIPLHISLRRAWQNEYYLNMADESITIGDYVTASQCCYKFNNYGIDKYYALSIIRSTALLSVKAGDIYRARGLIEFSEQL